MGGTKNRTTSKWRRLFVIIGLIILLILLIPIPGAYNDGGSISYDALIYNVSSRHAYWEEDGYDGFLVGIQIRIFGRLVFDNTRFEKWGGN